MPVLRVTGAGHVQRHRIFVDNLLLLRDRTSLEACLLKFDRYIGSDVPYVKLWIRHALLCHVRVLSLSVYIGGDGMVNELRLDNLPVGIVMMLPAGTVIALMMTAQAVFLSKFILKRDLRWCPTFSKLKTLLLSEWCVVGDHRALICIIQHSPVVEMLTLQLSEDMEPKNMVPSKAIYNFVDQPLPPENLQRVKVKCHKVDQTVHNILKSLITYGVPLEKINIQQENKSSECFTFFCTGFSSMPRMSKKTSMGCGVDRLGALPDELLHHVMSFLPAHEMVSTSLLARRWRDLWKTAPALCVTGVKGCTKPPWFICFVDNLLLLRHPGARLDSFVIDLDDQDFDFMPFLPAYERSVNLWFRHALLSKVGFFHCAHPMASTWCPALVELKMERDSEISGDMSAPYLKHLRIVHCDLPMFYRMRVSLPSLVSLVLSDCCAMGTVAITMGHMIPVIVLVVIILARTGTFVVNRDLKLFCPTFRKLKTLLLSEFCPGVAVDLNILTFFLNHSPLLEKLTFQLSKVPLNLEVQGKETWDVDGSTNVLNHNNGGKPAIVMFLYILLLERSMLLPLEQPNDLTC
ncbi:hypothetical protein BAE44_0022567 [Dichanthelium oligosanthes]|uniref:F-box domain-containing protein n=1 Tax=Dichanthelium oligosanthes TaxID=888268 RepID=A0A1E5UU71_9POAL|nr:hypothetical protein BAE44_0022567 [Dichanthelium oligosanthes]